MPSFLPFSKRLVAHPRIAVAGPLGGPGPYSLAVVDQLLVASGAVQDVISTLGSLPARLNGPYQAHEIATVFEGLRVPVAEDFSIVKIDGLSRTSVIGNRAAAFVLADAVAFLAHLPAGTVTVNHVLVPAPFVGVGCPAGPPRQVGEVSIAGPPPSMHQPEVNVIDAGYIDWWKPRYTTDKSGRVGPWPGKNPLTHYADVTVNRAQWLPGSQPTSTLASNFAAGASNWQDGTPDVPSANTKGILDMLAGHANFVASVIAEHCDQPLLHVWSHRGSFVGDVRVGTVDEFPVEAAVCRSIVQAHRAHPTQLVQAGFAFSPEVKAAGFATEYPVQQTPSGVWERTFKLIAEPPALFVCPAGNEGTPHPYYPAALDTAFQSSGTFSLVKGVASLKPDVFTASWFTNYGGWVRCSAVGENVEGCFIPVQHVRCEEGPGEVQSFANAWATWKGTSFAAPKVAGELAARIANDVGPAAAWSQLTMVYGTGGAPDPRLGFKFENL